MERYETEMFDRIGRGGGAPVFITLNTQKAAGKTNRLSSNKQLLNFYYHHGRIQHKDTKYICTTQFQLSLFSPCHSSF